MRYPCRVQRILATYALLADFSHPCRWPLSPAIVCGRKKLWASRVSSEVNKEVKEERESRKELDERRGPEAAARGHLLLRGLRGLGQGRQVPHLDVLGDLPSNRTLY